MWLEVLYRFKERLVSVIYSCTCILTSRNTLLLDIECQKCKNSLTASPKPLAIVIEAFNFTETLLSPTISNGLTSPRCLGVTNVFISLSMHSLSSFNLSKFIIFNNQLPFEGGGGGLKNRDHHNTVKWAWVVC